MGQTGKRTSIGFVFPGVVDFYKEEILDGAMREAEAKDIDLFTFINEKKQESEEDLNDRNQVTDLLRPGSVDGLIVLSSAITTDYASHELFRYVARFAPTPVVSIGVEVPGVPSVIIDNESGMRAMMEHLVGDHGYRRIGFIRGPVTNTEAETRYAVYGDVLREHGIPVETENVLQSGFFVAQHYSPGIDEIRRFVAERPDLEAVVCANDAIAYNTVAQAAVCGLSVPGDLGVVGFDNFGRGRSMLPPLTTVHQPLEKIGEMSLKLILEAVSGKVLPARSLIQTRLIVRRSCGCRHYLAEEGDCSCDLALKSIQAETDASLFADCFLSGLRQTLADADVELCAKWSRLLGRGYETFVKDEDPIPFLDALERCVLEGIAQKIDSAPWSEVLNGVLRGLPTKDPDSESRKNALWRDGLAMLGVIAGNRHASHATIIQSEFVTFNFLSQEIHASANREELRRTIYEIFPRIGFGNFVVALYMPNEESKAIVFAAYLSERGALKELEGKEFDASLVVPDGFGPFAECRSYIVCPLACRKQRFGFAVMESGAPHRELYENFSNLVSITLLKILLDEDIENRSLDLERKVFERTSELEEAYERLKSLNVMKNDFIANITHDFRSPLTIIMGISDFAVRFPEDSDTVEDMKLIYASSLKLQDTIDRLLSLARIDARGVHPSVQKMDIAGFLKGIVRYYSSAAERSGILVTGKFPAEGADDFWSDSDKLEEIMNNLVSNAVKFVDRDRGVIEIELTLLDGEVEIRVKDNGAGIRGEMLERIFERFTQARPGRNTRYGGTGIGLAFSRRLVECLKGRLWAESEGEGLGAAFVFRLPRGGDWFDPEDLASRKPMMAEEDETRLADQNQFLLEKDLDNKNRDEGFLVSIAKRNAAGEFDPRKGLILIIDDDPAVCRIVRRYLETRGYRNFILADGGHKGFEAAARYEPDLILCDYNMPDMMGNELHDAILTDPVLRRVPFIFLSALADRDLAIERREKGASAYLKKPIDARDLVLTIDQHMKFRFEFLEMKEKKRDGG